MKYKHIYAIVFVLSAIGFIYYLFRSTDTSNYPANSSNGVNQLDSLSLVEKIALHPLADAVKRENYLDNTVISNWDEWIDAWTEYNLGSITENGDQILTHADVEIFRKRLWEEYAAELAEYRKTHPPPKNLSDNHPTPLIIGKTLGSYTGPQTAEALISEFDVKYIENRPESADWDEHLSKVVILQKALEIGFHFDDYSDYADILNLRGQVLNYKNAPAVWRSGALNIPITTNFEEYVDGFIHRKIWELNTIDKVFDENPYASAVSVLFPPSHPDKYLPVVGKMTYVRQKPSGAMMTWGATLTHEQRQNLLYNGIEPENIEIVYIDEEYNLVGKPKPVDRDKWREENSYDIVPEGLRAPDGTIVSPERYEEISGEPMTAETRQKYDEYVDAEFPEDLDAARREAARAAAEAARAAAEAAAKAQYEKFENHMRQLQEFSTMSDAEIKKHLERQFRKQFRPEHPKEQLELITPRRLERAFGTLFQYGYEDGMKRIRDDNETLADLLERHFGRRAQPPTSAPKNTPKPVPPKPPETTDTPADTD